MHNEIVLWKRLSLFYENCRWQPVEGSTFTWHNAVQNMLSVGRIFRLAAGSIMYKHPQKLCHQHCTQETNPVHVSKPLLMLMLTKGHLFYIKGYKLVI